MTCPIRSLLPPALLLLPLLLRLCATAAAAADTPIVAAPVAVAVDEDGSGRQRSFTSGTPPPASAEAAPAAATFIISVRDGHDPHAVAARVNRRAAATALQPRWRGRVERVHHLVSMLVVRGDPATCAVLAQLHGVDFCEPDSVLSLDDDPGL